MLVVLMLVNDQNQSKDTKELLDFVTWCDEILNLLLWINKSTWRRLKNHGPVKFNFKHFLFYSSKFKNEWNYEYFTLLWSTLLLALCLEIQNRTYGRGH